MASLAGLNFEGATGLIDTHEVMQDQAGTATWVPEFFPAIKGPCKFVAEVLFWVLHSLGLCCAIAGEFAAYMRANWLQSQNSAVHTWLIMRNLNLPTVISTF